MNKFILTSFFLLFLVGLVSAGTYNSTCSFEDGWYGEFNGEWNKRDIELLKWN